MFSQNVAEIESAKTSKQESAAQPSEMQGCVAFASLFQHPLMEDAPTSSASADERRQYMMMVRKAENVCGSCPLMAQCLYDAVAKHDVAGFVGGTTPRQRQEIRQRLQITVAPEDFDSLAGVTGRNRQIDHDEVVRLRAANPHESLETLAHRLGCSLSTIKRHLRRHRHEAASPAPVKKPSLPTMAAVINAYRQVVGQVSVRRAA